MATGGEKQPTFRTARAQRTVRPRLGHVLSTPKGSAPHNTVRHTAGPFCLFFLAHGARGGGGMGGGCLKEGSRQPFYRWGKHLRSGFGYAGHCRNHPRMCLWPAHDMAPGCPFMFRALVCSAGVWCCPQGEATWLNLAVPCRQACPDSCLVLAVGDPLRTVSAPALQQYGGRLLCQGNRSKCIAGLIKTVCPLHCDYNVQ